MATLNISLPDEMRAFVDEQASGGSFSTPSEYVRHLIREDRKRIAREKLEALLLEGLDSGPMEEMTPQDWADIRAEVAERIRLKKKAG
ncbi:MAG: type II toxin-antitoxin system ParD family antitoxin [Candidatus Methylomirabilis sp.]|nr:type II toxin-antitoxin system ParD family antitoxin [Deltaproteobacteria bacterium]